MLTYRPGGTIAHRLDPRSKLAVQAGFAVAAAANPRPADLIPLAVVAGAVLAAARTSPIAALRDLRAVLPLLAVAPVFGGLTWGSPWFSVAEAVDPALAAVRILLVLFVSAAYVRTTPVRDSRAALQRTVPGRPGQFLGVGVAIVFRFLPVLVGDLSRSRDAMRARLGTERPLHERARIVATAGLDRAFERADRLSVALRARCLAWNPTLPALRFGRADYPALAAALALALWGVSGTLSSSAL